MTKYQVTYTFDGTTQTVDYYTFDDLPAFTAQIQLEISAKVVPFEFDNEPQYTIEEVTL
jgi:hypothetical protein